MRASKWHTEHSLRRGGRVRLNAHAWNACRLERVSGVRIPPSPPPSPYLSRYLAPTTEKPAPAASFAYAWSRRKPLEQSASGEFESAASPLLEAVGDCTSQKGPADFSGRRLSIHCFPPVATFVDIELRQVCDFRGKPLTAHSRGPSFHRGFSAPSGPLRSITKSMCSPPFGTSIPTAPHDTHIARFASYSQSCGQSPLCVWRRRSSARDRLQVAPVG
jgi:hypothetical protein